MLLKPMERAEAERKVKSIRSLLSCKRSYRTRVTPRHEKTIRRGKVGSHLKKHQGWGPMQSDSGRVFVFHIWKRQENGLEFLCGIQAPDASIDASWVDRIPDVDLCPHCLDKHRESQIRRSQNA